MNKSDILTSKKREEEQAAGWHVIDNGRRLFSLEATYPDPPFYCFKVIDIDCPHEQVVEVLNSAKREPRASLFYQNRKYKNIVEDRFMFGGYGNGDVTLKDYRYIHIPKWWDGLVFWKKLERPSSTDQ